MLKATTKGMRRAASVSCQAEGRRNLLHLGWLLPPSQPIPEPGRHTLFQSSCSSPGSGLLLGLGRLLREISFQTLTLSVLYFAQGKETKSYHRTPSLQTSQRCNDGVFFLCLLHIPSLPPRCRRVHLIDKEGFGTAFLSKELCQESSALLCCGSAVSTEGFQGTGCRGDSCPDPLLGARKKPGCVVQSCPPNATGLLRARVKFCRGTGTPWPPSCWQCLPALARHPGLLVKLSCKTCSWVDSVT